MFECNTSYAESNIGIIDGGLNKENIIIYVNI